MSDYLEKNTLRKFQKGAVIFKEGAAGNSMFIITAGSVEISTIIDGKKVVLASLGKGAMFGEMALLGDRIRSATVTTETEVICHEINRILFKNQIGDLPNWMRGLFKVLVDRLKETNKHHTTVSNEDIKVQILRMLVFVLEKDGKDHVAARYVFWKQSVETIYSLLNILPNEVENVMNRLTISPIASSKIGDGNARIFLAKDIEEFKQFVEFCRAKYSESRGALLSGTYDKISTKEHQLLNFISRITQKQIDDTEIREDLFNGEFTIEFDKDISDYELEVKRLSKLGILKRTAKFDTDKFYIFDREKLDQRLEIGKKMGTFLSVEQSIFHS